jgi:hypothetical protein
MAQKYPVVDPNHVSAFSGATWGNVGRFLGALGGSPDAPKSVTSIRNPEFGDTIPQSFRSAPSRTPCAKTRPTAQRASPDGCMATATLIFLLSKHSPVRLSREQAAVREVQATSVGVRGGT